jgi:5-methylcytosine-specific restriction protein A
MAHDVNAMLASLRPNSPAMVMDLVRDAGIDVGAWAIRKDGTPVATPQTNPAYCYEWSFGGDDEPRALCVWYRHITIADGRICFEGNMRYFASELDKVLYNPTSPSGVISRARSQAKRARDFDLAVQRAAFKKQPLRIILLLGDDAKTDNIGWDKSAVRYRLLDSAPWLIEQYNMNSGRFRLARADPIVVGFADVVPVEPPPRFLDQFSVPTPGDRVTVESIVRQRSPEVRRKVLERAQGNCECCGEAGFKMVNGAIYLETHHVIPLGENGPDEEWNVVAICPDDHRRAHFAVERDKLRNQLIDTLSTIYPSAQDALRSLSAARADASHTH